MQTVEVKDQSCKARIDSHLKGRMNDLKKLWANECNGIEDDPEVGNLNEYGLCFDYVAPNTFKGQRKGYFRYQISYGGPQDEFRFYLDENLHPHRIDYAFLDWFDGAIKPLMGANNRLMLEIFDNYFSECYNLREMINEGLEV